MAYTVMATQVTGYVVLASDWNEIVNNFIEMVPDKFTADGEVAIGTGANALEVVAILDASNFLKHEYGGLEFDLNAITTNDGVGGASAGVMEIKTPVTQAEAEAGTNTRFSLWSSQRVKQAVDALGTGVQVYCSIAAAGTLNSNSKNVASVTDTGTGDRTIVIATDFANTNYTCVGGFREENISGGHSNFYFDTVAVGSIRHRIYNESVSLEDQSTSVAMFGVQ